MAINEIVTNLNTMVLGEIACTQDSDNIVIPTQPPTVDFCHCDFECEYQEEVFASPGNEDYKNDKSYHLAESVDSSGTIVFSLYKNGALIGSIIDDTYGTFYAKGSVPNTSTTDQSNKSGFIIEWEKVYNTLGIGVYYLEIEVTNFSRTVTKETQKYNLSVFSERGANNTFVIKSTQNGYIQGGYDYSGLNWSYQFRIPGKFLRATSDFVKTTFQSSERDEKQIQSQTIRNYSLYCDFIPAIISDTIIDDNIMSNEILITDYNLWNTSSLTYQSISVVPEGIEEEEYYDRSQNGSFEFSFKPKRQNKLKRNFK